MPLRPLPNFSSLRIIAVTEAIIVWGINRLLTKLRHPPKFHGSVLFHIVAEAPTQGVLLAFIPTLLTVLFVWCWFAENSFTASSDPVTSPSAINFEGITGYAATSFVGSHRFSIQYVVLRLHQL